MAAERIISTPGSPQTEPDAQADVQPAQADDAAGATAADGARAALRRRRVGVLFSVALFAYVIDLISKLVVVAKLEGRSPIRIISDVVTLQVIRNPGAAFGMGQTMTVVFTLIAAAVIVVIWRISRRLYSLPWAIALGLLLGGALGNLTDRLFRAPGVFRGHVVDFISVQHFAVFNLADSAIVCGGILVVLLSFRGSNPDGSVHKPSSAKTD
ncbi:signal peptidase II [Kitasatospora sp. MAA4]|uniref:signal peptidase II n=1 Tax=Kitasatospora sp. MAA4 TaxID=3035093 RepID=UPI002475A5E9|nr:signal peptidase II [Kitasatospora sp. MAA4]MDH6132620.1 signal peptidase II [Kitasatospora sp. MAA4]